MPLTPGISGTLVAGFAIVVAFTLASNPPVAQDDGKGRAAFDGRSLSLFR
jgi:hypothetical protein